MKKMENKTCDIAESFFNSKTEPLRNLDDSFYFKEEKKEIIKVNEEPKKLKIEITLDIPEDMKYQKEISLTVNIN